jgi:hypothetical protein
MRTQKIPEMTELEEPCDDGKTTFVLIPDEGYSVQSWRPGPPRSGPPTQVHLVLSLPIEDAKLVLRLKSARALDELVGVLLNHRQEVWGAKNGD